jgi:hypothetical protein
MSDHLHGDAAKAFVEEANRKEVVNKKYRLDRAKPRPWFSAGIAFASVMLALVFLRDGQLFAMLCMLVAATANVYYARRDWRRARL